MDNFIYVLWFLLNVVFPKQENRIMVLKFVKVNRSLYVPAVENFQNCLVMMLEYSRFMVKVELYRNF